MAITVEYVRVTGVVTTRYRLRERVVGLHQLQFRCASKKSSKSQTPIRGHTKGVNEVMYRNYHFFQGNFILLIKPMIDLPTHD